MGFSQMLKTGYPHETAERVDDARAEAAQEATYSPRHLLRLALVLPLFAGWACLFWLTRGGGTVDVIRWALLSIALALSLGWGPLMRFLDARAKR